jgi:hypothetical protein
MLDPALWSSLRDGFKAAADDHKLFHAFVYFPDVRRASLESHGDLVSGLATDTLWWKTWRLGDAGPLERVDVAYLPKSQAKLVGYFVGSPEGLAAAERLMPMALQSLEAEPKPLGPFPRPPRPCGPPSHLWMLHVFREMRKATDYAKGVKVGNIRLKRVDFLEPLQGIDPKATIWYLSISPLQASEMVCRRRARAGRIPPRYRTRPMPLREAARLMGYGSSQDAAERLRAAITAGAVRCEQLTRQQHVFSKKEFPREVWGQLNSP